MVCFPELFDGFSVRFLFRAEGACHDQEAPSRRGKHPADQNDR
jgi:hypothetical protein